MLHRWVWFRMISSGIWRQGNRCNHVVHFLLDVGCGLKRQKRRNQSERLEYEGESVANLDEGVDLTLHTVDGRLFDFALLTELFFLCEKLFSLLL